MYLISAYQLDSNITAYLVSDNHQDSLQVDFAITVIGWDVSACSVCFCGEGGGGGGGMYIYVHTYECKWGSCFVHTTVHM